LRSIALLYRAVARCSLGCSNARLLNNTRLLTLLLSRLLLILLLTLLLTIGTSEHTYILTRYGEGDGHSKTHQHTLQREQGTGGV